MVGGLNHKPYRKLNREDFDKFPVWEWILDENSNGIEDETWVRPMSLASVPKSEFAQYLVSANATLRDGSLVPACVEVTVCKNSVEFEPLFVFLLDRHLDFIGMETTRLLSRYTKYPDNRPVQWELRVYLEGEHKFRKRKVTISSAVARAMAFVSRLASRKINSAKHD